MKTNRLFVLLATLLIVGGFGCEPGGSPEGGDLARSSSALLFWFPTLHHVLVGDLIGIGLNGRDLNGKALDGLSVASVSLQDVQVAKGKSKDLRLAQTSFRGSVGSGLKYAKKSLVGAVFAATLDNGDPLPLRIDDAVPGADSVEGTLLYAVSYPIAGGWAPLCGLDAQGSPRLAIPLNGVWDFNAGTAKGGSWMASAKAFTFACQGYVLEKCVAMGYPPWQQGRLCDDDAGDCIKTTLAAYHQACARALRADYCGDGTSFTVDGTPINLYDGLGIRTDGENWAFEAEWNAAGAVCVVRERLAAEPVPGCIAGLAGTGCGSPAHFGPGTLLMTEVAPAVAP